MAKTRGKAKDRRNAAEEASNRIFTVPNVISAIRLCLVPVFLVLLLHGYDLMATFLYALAAGTDWIDGQIARRTHTVSKLGQLLDPAVDRILMIAGVAGLFVVGRLPLWIILVVLLRDLLLLVGGALLIKAYRIRVAVVFPGARWPPPCCSSGSRGFCSTGPFLAAWACATRRGFPASTPIPSPGASGSCTPGSCWRWPRPCTT